MPLLGPAALAMWWDMAPALRREFEDWHSHEHFPERLGIPGFLRASRWASADDGEGFFVLYELASYETLTSPAYRARLNDPTPWPRKMMPEHRNMVRSQTRVLESAGTLLGGVIATLRFSPVPGEAESMRAALARELPRLAAQPGLVGAHLLQTDTPDAPQTAEQRIRGGDRAADAILLLAGLDLDAVRRTLAAASPAPESQGSLFRLSYSATAADF